MSSATFTTNSDSTGLSQSNKQEQRRYRSNSYDIVQTKRMRTGSISGRLRTASDLEQLGYIDKKQKGLIKDLIISGDTVLQSLLDKYERGDGKELLDLINQGYLGRKESIDLLDGLDFDFMNGFKSDEEGEGGDSQFDNFEFSWNDGNSGAPTNNNHNNNHNIIHQLSGHHSQYVANNHPSAKSSSSAVPIPPPPIVTANGLLPQPPPGVMGPPTSTIRSPTSMKIAPSTANYGKARTLSEVAMDIMEKRKESFDSLNISEMIFDDLIGSGVANHSSGTDTDLGLFDDLLYEQSTQPPQQRRSLRLDSFAETFAHHQQLAEGADVSNGDNVDLSAYATLAQSLQNSKNKSSINNKDSSKLNLKIKFEGNSKGLKTLPPQTSDGQKFKMNKGLLLPTTSATIGLNPSSSHNPSLHSSSGFHSSSSVATNAMVNNISLKAKHESGTCSPSSELQRTLGFSGSVASPSSLPGQKPIVTTSGFIGAYTPDQRKLRIERFLEKRTRRVWTRKVKYDVRKNFADSRLRIKGRFVKKEDEDMMRELMSL